LAEHLHHLSRLEKLPEEWAYLPDLGSRPAGDAPFAPGIEDFGPPPLLPSHGAQEIASLRFIPASASRCSWEEIFATPDPDPADRHAGHRLHGQHRPSARVSVQFGHDQSGKADRLVESIGDPHRLLPGRHVRPQETFSWQPTPHGRF
jgi:hypothetical protein